jgi:hypothetical protein
MRRDESAIDVIARMIPFPPELRTVGWKGTGIDNGQWTMDNGQWKMDNSGMFGVRLRLRHRLRLDFGGDWPKLWLRYEYQPGFH